MSTDAVPDVTNPRERYARWVLPLCWSAVALEGFDLVVLGVVLPSLLRYPAWGLTPNTASLISVVGLLGVMAGALASGPVTDLIGRRRAMLITVVGFSVLTLLCAAAPNPWLFGLLRFLAGLGLGGVLPVALALVNEYAKPGRDGGAITVMMTGYHVGAVLTSLLGIVVIPGLGWRPMFVVGAAPALVLAPLMLRFLPESTWYLRARAGLASAESARAERAADAGNPLALLFRPGYLRATVAFWVASFMGLLLVYGLNTWLPEIMRSAGYQLGAALALLLVLNVGAVLGLLVSGRVANRVGVRPAVLGWFVAAMVFLALLSVKLPGAGVYLSVLLAGVFVFSSQVLVYAYVGQRYPTWARGTALGTASGVGRLGAITGPLIGGALLTAGIAYPWGFYIFAAVAAIAAVAVAAVTPPQVSREPEGRPSPDATRGPR
jgi:AAHS family benzoate transporter-like MFS transporter